MNFVSISDVHIKAPGDFPEKLFLEFLRHPKTQKADIIFLLGDIFDLLVGKGFNVVDRYNEVFSELRNLLLAGKKIHQFEGNHDFHFKKLLKDLCVEWNIDADSWQYYSNIELMNIGDKKILFGHGDEIEIGNYSYKFYKLWIRSFPIKFLSNYVVPGQFVQAIGDRASANSRARNEQRYDEYSVNEEVRPSFRKAARIAATNNKADIVICGHSHCKDHINENGVEYINNGYFPVTKSFVSYEEGRLSFVEVGS